jgi:iron complex transport system ATP-binding protein
MARALATQAPVLPADAPVAALDLCHQVIVLELLRAPTRTGETAAAILHDLSLTTWSPSGNILPEQVKIHVFGSPESVLAEARLASGFGIGARVAKRKAASWRWRRALPEA